MADNSRNEFGEFLKNRRKAKGYSTRELGKVAGVSHGYISQIEKGTRSAPSPSILKKIHRHLDVSYDVLMKKAGHIEDNHHDVLQPEVRDILQHGEDIENILLQAMQVILDYFTSTGELQYGELISFLSLENALSEEEMEQLKDSESWIDWFTALTPKAQIAMLDIAVILYRERANTDLRDILIPSDQEPTYKVVKVPLLGRIAAGKPIMAEENRQGWIEVTLLPQQREEDIFVLEVEGDSMINSRIYEGDWVVVQTQPDVESGQIAAVNVNGDEATLKRVKKTDDGETWLFPSNDNYDPIKIVDDNARILGKVVQVIFTP